MYCGRCHVPALHNQLPRTPAPNHTHTNPSSLPQDTVHAPMISPATVSAMCCPPGTANEGGWRGVGESARSMRPCCAVDGTACTPTAPHQVNRVWRSQYVVSASLLRPAQLNPGCHRSYLPKQASCLECTCAAPLLAFLPPICAATAARSCTRKRRAGRWSRRQGSAQTKVRGGGTMQAVHT